MAEKKEKKTAEKEEKKKRWSSHQRLEREKKRTTEKPDKIRWRLQLKKHNDLKKDLAKKRKERSANRKKLIEKGVIKQA